MGGSVVSFAKQFWPVAAWIGVTLLSVVTAYTELRADVDRNTEHRVNEERHVSRYQESRSAVEAVQLAALREDVRELEVKIDMLIARGSKSD